MRREELLVNHLAVYAKSDMCSFHMPRHKRRTGPEGFFMNSCVDSFTSPFAVDVAEIEGFDNLHHSEDILRDSMKQTADIYRADQIYYMINGDTGRMLAAAYESVPRGGRVLVSRNYHKSVYHGVCLNRLKTSYAYPQETGGLGIQGGITVGDVDRVFNQHMDTRAVPIVCPAYDRIISDIKTITRTVHRAGLPLIANEIHGAYFRCDAMLPVSALDLGAGVVIQNIHRILPSLIQTTLFHIKCNRPDGGYYVGRRRIDRYIHMVQSSSPSYVLMASIENSTYQIGQTDMAPYGKQLYKLRRRLGQTRHLRLVDTGLIGQIGIRGLDISKIVVPTRGTCLYPAEDRLTEFTGAQLDDILRGEYHLETEMCGVGYVTVITTVMNNGGGLERLGNVLIRIDNQLTDAGYKPDGRSGDRKSVCNMRCDTAISMRGAMEENVASVSLESSAGRISEGFVYIYSPGTPTVALREWISRPILEMILEYRDKGFPVQEPVDQSLRTIQVV